MLIKRKMSVNWLIFASPTLISSLYQKLDRNGNLSTTADCLHKHSTDFSQCSVDIYNLDIKH